MQVCTVRDKKLKIGIAHQMIKTHVVVISSSADCSKVIISRAGGTSDRDTVAH